MNKSNLISVIIPVKNAAPWIEETLTALRKQKCSMEKEVIVLDSGSTDGTLDILKKFAVRLVHIAPEEFQHGRTRNLGAQVANGAIFVFLNQDAIPRDTDWLDVLCEPLHRDPDIAGVCSYLIPRLGCNPLIQRDMLGFPQKQPPSPWIIKSLSPGQSFDNLLLRGKLDLISFHTVGCAIPRRVFDKFPFAEIPFGEDREWGKKILENEKKLCVNRAAVVIHSHEFYASFADTFRIYFDNGTFFSRILRLKKDRSFTYLWLASMLLDWKFIWIQRNKMRASLRWILRSPWARLAQWLGLWFGFHYHHLPPAWRKCFSIYFKHSAEIK